MFSLLSFRKRGSIVTLNNVGESTAPWGTPVNVRNYLPLIAAEVLVKQFFIALTRGLVIPFFANREIVSCL